MTNLDIAHRRLHNQLITHPTFEKPGDVVQWLGAVQAQDYAAAKWAVGLRLQSATSDDIEQAVADGSILRTHVMRPTWHFVSPADIRWLLTLTAPRVHAASAYYYQTLGLDNAIFTRSNAALAKALQGGKQLTRLELVSVLQQIGIVTENLGFLYIIMHAELDGVVCSGARRGNQFTYALLEERVPQTRTLDHDEALAEFARRYFTSHGPATLQDFVWWSGLTTADARAGLAMAASELMHEVVDDQTYWFAASAPSAKELSQMAYLLPNFDEYTVGYKDRSAIIDASHTEKFDSRGSVLNNVLVLDGQVVGTWRRTLKKDAVIITPNLFIPLTTAETHAFVAEANRYGAFLEKKSVHTTLEVE
nr:winged helix DNA-binding domain-containing protein [Ktedonobacteraceae bacterium]